jgi:hypothetical protein
LAEGVGSSTPAPSSEEAWKETCEAVGIGIEARFASLTLEAKVRGGSAIGTTEFGLLATAPRSTTVWFPCLPGGNVHPVRTIKNTSVV